MHTISQRRPFGAYAGPRRPNAAWFGKILREAAVRAVRTLLTWQERDQQRRHLAALDDRLLSDIGISRADAAREAAVPFWRLS